MSQRGSGLLDAIAATAIGLLVAHAATDTVAAIRALAATEARDRLLVTARNHLEHALAAPCAPVADCPPEAECTIDTVVVSAGPPVLTRVRVSIAAAGRTLHPATLVGVRKEACA
jgi:hypothetical protein